MPKAAVIGIGNPLRKDDGIAPLILEKLGEQRDRLPSGLDFIDAGIGGMSLLHYFPKYDTVVIVDAVDFGGEPGETRFFSLEDVQNENMPIKLSTHVSDVMNILQLSYEIGEAPDELFVFGIQPKEVTVEKGLTVELDQAVDSIISELIAKITSLFKNKS